MDDQSKLTMPATATAPKTSKMTLTHDLGANWNRLVSSGAFVNEFTAVYDDNDREPAWSKGELIQVGLSDHDGQPTYFAQNLSRRKPIVKELLDDPIPGCPVSEDPAAVFTKVLIPYRNLRSVPLPHQIGPQPMKSLVPKDCGFQCQDSSHPGSLLARAPLSLVSLAHEMWGAYYNFSPFEANGHLLLLPVKFDGGTLTLPHVVQRMTFEWLAEGIELFAASSNLMLFWNSIHAGATQPGHFHYQIVFAGNRRLPLQRNKVQPGHEYAYLADYPIVGLAFPVQGSVERVWACVHSLQESGKPYNLIMLEDTIYLVPRNPDEEITSEFPWGVFESMEMAGRLVLSDRDNYLETDYARLLSALQKCGLSRREVYEITGLV